MPERQLEPWQRGPLPLVAPTLQPAAHALVAALEDVVAAVAGLSVDQLWTRPGGAASIGYHLAHLSGSTDRLLTYARGLQLSAEQFAALEAERQINTTRPSLESLLAAWDSTVQRALDQIAQTQEADLFQPRRVGRAGLPSNVIGLVFHAAEHAQRHAGQIVTTAIVVRGDRRV